MVLSVVDKLGSTTSAAIALIYIAPTDLHTVVRKLVHKCFRDNAQRVWLAYLLEREIDVAILQADGSIAYKTYGINDTLTGGDVLPGFSVAVADVFPK